MPFANLPMMFAVAGATTTARRTVRIAPRRMRVPRKRSPASTEITDALIPSSERGDKIKAELDDLLDEIDEVLEDNAEEFVRNYVQKGGQ